MLDLDPRDYDSRDEERHTNTPSRGGRDSSGDHDRDHDWRQPDARTRDRDDGDEWSLGRGPGNDPQGSDREGRDRDHDPRWTDRDRDDRDRDREVRDTFSRHLYLPRGRERELVHDRDREYTLRGSESRTLATVGAFRVVSSGDLRDLWSANIPRGDPHVDSVQRSRGRSAVPLYRYHGPNTDVSHGPAPRS